MVHASTSPSNALGTHRAANRKGPRFAHEHTDAYVYIWTYFSFVFANSGLCSWGAKSSKKLGKPIQFIVNLPESCVFIDIFDIVDPESPKSCVFIDIFDIFDIWRSLCNWAAKTSQREYPWIAELVKGYSLWLDTPNQGKARKNNTFHSQLARELCFHLHFWHFWHLEALLQFGPEATQRAKSRKS